MKETVLVTGGCGFIGRQVCRELREAGYDVRALDSLVEQVHAASDIDLPPDVEFICGDVRDSDAVRSAVAGTDAVVHLAAEVGVGQSMYEIPRYVGANDLGTAVLLQAIIDNPVRRIVVASSMSVYGEGLYLDARGNRRDDVRRDGKRVRAALWDPVDIDGQPLTPVATDETKRVDLASIYALTKYAQERSVLITAEAYGIEAAALRLFNVFGPGQALSNPYTGVLANFGSRLTNGNAPTIFEDGRQQRDFVHVSDVARAFRLALESDRISNDVINIGSGQAYPIETVAEMLAAAMGKSSIRPQVLGKARAGDIRHCFADISRAQSFLGFEPTHFLEDSLDELAAWISSETAIVDRGAEMRTQLEKRGLVS